MITGLDHVVILVRDIEVGVATYQALLARKPAWRNQSDGADSVLFTLDNMSVELLAPSGDGAAADRIRGAIEANGEGLASLCFRVSDIVRLHRRLDRLALKPEPIADAESRNTLSDASLAWKRTRAATEATRGVRMFFLEMAAERPRSDPGGLAPITGLDHVVISTTDSERAAALYGARLGLDMALDRSHPDWGRLMFFRCGDLIVEVVHRRGAETAARDSLWGLSWRVDDIDATRSRLLAAGLDISEVRTGRKPGTRIATVRNGSCGVPTVLLERSPRPA
jgi:catechol 2,3-dioxygenase-like lactoylglutathione lyase family enzyme